jgi:hypothetical protein
MCHSPTSYRFLKQKWQTACALRNFAISAYFNCKGKNRRKLLSVVQNKKKMSSPLIVALFHPSSNFYASFEPTAWNVHRPIRGRPGAPVCQAICFISKATQVIFNKYRTYCESIAKLPEEIQVSPVKVKLSPVRHEDVSRNEGTGPRILNLGRRWSVFSFTTRPLYTEGKRPRNPLDSRLGGPQSRSGYGG